MLNLTHQFAWLCRGHKMVVFVLNDFDMFAAKARQTVLYNLLDCMQAPDIQARRSLTLIGDEPQNSSDVVRKGPFCSSSAARRRSASLMQRSRLCIASAAQVRSSVPVLRWRCKRLAGGTGGYERQEGRGGAPGKAGSGHVSAISS